MNVREKAMVKLVGGAIGFAILYATLLKNGLGDSGTGSRLKMMAVAVPGAFLLAGLIELVTGAPFQQVSTQWDSLQGWQRGVLGIVIVIVSAIVLMGAMVMFA
ncbi:hypothetical protein [Massilia sp. CCM 8734]|uniref:hypothetical protein n=1 Tax=Massilia sp. CCM 8734 TaxID=2609283 RepID=UPI0014212C9D|nr:hypothetical protein [Massilia sp. CCM 8734]NIA00288.1 hypothetical protein [Massilia sp. CCM 8734]